jgi:hypothetical protein
LPSQRQPLRWVSTTGKGTGIARKLRERLTFANVISVVALFVALGGTSAYALEGSNTVFTDDIVDQQVKTADIDAAAVTNGKIASDAVNSAKIASGGVTTTDLADAAVAQAKLGPNSVISRKVADNSLKGDDIDESTLSNVKGTVGPTEGTSADNFSRDGRTHTAEITVDASPFTTTLAGRLLIIKPIAKVVAGCSDLAGVSLWIEVDGVAVPGSVIRMSQNSPQNFTLAGVTASSVPAGDHTARVAMECSSTATITSWGWDDVGAVSAVVLGG